MELKEHDPVNNPSHYQSKSGLESIDVIEAFELNFHIGNAVKYLLRHGKKENKEGDKNQDIKKAIWYLNRELSRAKDEDTKEIIKYITTIRKYSKLMGVDDRNLNKLPDILLKTLYLLYTDTTIDVFYTDRVLQNGLTTYASTKIKR